MRVESYNVLDAHGVQFLKHLRSVKTLAGIASMLSAAVKQRHYDGDTFRFTARRAYHTFEIGVMIVRRHAVLFAEKRIFAVIVADVHEYVNVVTAYGILDNALAVAGGETGAMAFDYKRFFLEFGVFVTDVAIIPIDQIIVDTFAELFGPVENYKT